MGDMVSRRVVVSRRSRSSLLRCVVGHRSPDGSTHRATLTPGKKYAPHSKPPPQYVRHRGTVSTSRVPLRLCQRVCAVPGRRSAPMNPHRPHGLLCAAGTATGRLPTEPARETAGPLRPQSTCRIFRAPPGSNSNVIAEPLGEGFLVRH